MSFSLFLSPSFSLSLYDEVQCVHIFHKLQHLKLQWCWKTTPGWDPPTPPLCTVRQEWTPTPPTERWGRKARHSWQSPNLYHPWGPGKGVLEVQHRWCSWISSLPGYANAAYYLLFLATLQTDSWLPLHEPRMDMKALMNSLSWIVFLSLCLFFFLFHLLLTKMLLEDDVEAYLGTFKRMAHWKECPPGDWPSEEVVQCVYCQRNSA